MLKADRSDDCVYEVNQSSDVEVVWDELARTEPHSIASSVYNDSKEDAYQRVLALARKKLKVETNRRVKEAKLIREKHQQ